MTQADTVVEIQVAPGDAAPITSVRKALETIILTPHDLAFCQTHTELTPWVKELRAIESILQTGTFPDEAQGNSDWPSMQLDHCITTLLGDGGVDAVGVILHEAFNTAYNFDLKSQNARGIGYMGMVDVYMGSCLGAGVYLNDDTYHQAVEQALQPLFYKRGGGSEELYAGRFLTYKGLEGFLNMRVIDRPLDSSAAFDYYGVRFALDGLPEGGEYSASELEIGVLGVHDHQDNNRIVKIVNIHPDRIQYQKASKEIHVSAIEPKELFRQILGREVPGFEEDAEKFLSQYVPFYHEAPFAEGRFTRFFDIYERFGLTHSNANALPLEAKYYLWKNLCEVSGYYDKTSASKIYSLLDTYGADVAWVVQALKGEKQMLDSLANALANKEHDRDTADLFHAIAQSERYIVEAAYTVTASAGDAKGEHIQDRINYLLPIARGMAREAIMNIDVAEGMQIFTFGFAQYEKMLNLLCTYSDPHEVRNVPFDQEQRDRIGRLRGRFPDAPITGRMMTAAEFAQTLFNQRSTSKQERDAFLMRFYEHVITLGVYTPEKAKVFGDSELEIIRDVNAKKTLWRDGIVPRELYPTMRRLSVGCGDGNRVERPSYEKLAKKLPDAMPAEVIGLDMFPQGKDALWHAGMIGKTRFSFIQSPLEAVLDTRPDLAGTISWIDIHGSALNNMDLLAVQYQYFATLNRLLRPGGILMMDLGAIEPAAAWNQRYHRTRKFLQLFPHSPPGAIGIIDEYKRPDDQPGDIGAYLYPYASIRQLAEDSGFALLGKPGQPGFESDLNGIYQNPQVLMEETKSMPDGFRQPLWVANAPHKPEPDMNIRMTLFFQKKEDAHANPFVEPFLTARQILVGESHKGA